MYHLITPELLEQAGLKGLSGSELQSLCDYGNDKLELMTGEKMSETLNERQLDEFEELIDNHEETVQRLLKEYNDRYGDYHYDPIYSTILANAEENAKEEDLISEYVMARWLDINCPRYTMMIQESGAEVLRDIIMNHKKLLKELPSYPEEV